MVAANSVEEVVSALTDSLIVCVVRDVTHRPKTMANTMDSSAPAQTARMVLVVAASSASARIATISLSLTSNCFITSIASL